MAKIIEQLLVIRVSKLIKDSESQTQTLINEATLTELGDIAQQLIPDAVVEVVTE